MANKVRIGDHSFDAKQSGGRLSQDSSVKQLTRVSTGSFSGLLQTLNGVLTSNVGFVVIRGTSLILLKKIFVYGYFTNATGLYNVSEGFVFSPTLGYLINKDGLAIQSPYIPQIAFDNLDMVLQVDTSGLVLFDFTILGGTVNSITGVTPVAGDAVGGTCTIVYQSL